MDESERRYNLDMRVLADKAYIGRTFMERLPEEFKRMNHGKFIAMSYLGETLGVADTLAELNRKLKQKGIHGNAHIERIGYRYVAKTVR